MTEAWQKGLESTAAGVSSETAAANLTVGSRAFAALMRLRNGGPRGLRKGGRVSEHMTERDEPEFCCEHARSAEAEVDRLRAILASYTAHG